MKDDPTICMKTRSSDRQIVGWSTLFLISNARRTFKAATYYNGYSGARVVMPFGIGPLAKHKSSPQKWELRPSPPRLAEWIPTFTGMTARGSARVSQLTPLRWLLFS